MMEVKIETRGSESIVRLITSLDKLNLGKIGEVYSAGAVQHGRRYEFFVMGEGTQAAIHEGRWKTNKMIADENQDYVLQQLEKTADLFLEGRGIVSNFLRDAIDRIYGDTQIYPPTIPNQRYVRTNTLKSSWRKELFI